MSHIKKTRVVPPQAQRTEEYIAETRCDLCGKNKDEEGRGYNNREATIEARAGVSYHEGGNETRTEFDICTECFFAKVVPWMASQGASPRVTESSW